MADSPWSNITLSRGQVDQRLTALGCKAVKALTDDASMWVAPSGEPFSISYADCDATYLEGIVAQLDKWAKFHQD